MADHLPHSHLTDYEELTRIYQMVRANFEPGVMVDKSFLRKIEELVQRHTWTGDIGTGKAHLLDEKTLDKIAGDDKPDTVKVFNRIKAIEATIEDKAALQPYLITIGERAEQVAEAFKERQKATFDALRELMELVREYQEAERSRVCLTTQKGHAAIA